MSWQHSCRGMRKIVTGLDFYKNNNKSKSTIRRFEWWAHSVCVKWFQEGSSRGVQLNLQLEKSISGCCCMNLEQRHRDGQHREGTRSAAKMVVEFFFFLIIFNVFLFFFSNLVVNINISVWKYRIVFLFITAFRVINDESIQLSQNLGARLWQLHCFHGIVTENWVNRLNIL